MVSRSAVALTLAVILADGGAPAGQGIPVAQPNDNRTSAGELRNGVLTIALEATRAMWHPDGDSLPGLPVEVFAEPGKQPSAPGPLIRVPAGTAIRATIRNTLPGDTLTFHVPARITGAAETAGMDSVALAPGETRELRFQAGRPGNYLYRATGRSPLDRAFRIRTLLAGAIIVDSAGRPRPRDRVFVLLDAVDSLTPDGVPNLRRELLAINGRSWPHTERIRATAGDTIRWRIVNGSPGVHPMHLHGFYFKVEDFDGPVVTPDQARLPRLAVTERMTPFTTMSLSWVPERAGNWLFHCHFRPMPRRTARSAKPGRRRDTAHALTPKR